MRAVPIGLGVTAALLIATMIGLVIWNAETCLQRKAEGHWIIAGKVLFYYHDCEVRAGFD